MNEAETSKALVKLAKRLKYAKPRDDKPKSDTSRNVDSDDDGNLVRDVQVKRPKVTSIMDEYLQRRKKKKKK
jgi:hypothetical protein